MAEEKKTLPRVAICIPSGDTWMARMGLCLSGLLCRSAHEVALMPVNIAGADTCEGRNAMTAVSREHGAQWLLWIDADMMFPNDGLLRLLAHDKDIVGAEYRKRVPPYDAAGGFSGEIPDNTTGLIERPMIGLGFCLMKAEIFNKLPQPYFVRQWQTNFASKDNPRGFTTEDTYICSMARYLGFGVWCDMDLTREVHHLGVTPIAWNFAAAPEMKVVRDAMEAAQ